MMGFQLIIIRGTDYLFLEYSTFESLSIEDVEFSAHRSQRDVLREKVRSVDHIERSVSYTDN